MQHFGHFQDHWKRGSQTLIHERQDKTEAFQHKQLTVGYYKNKALLSWGGKDETCLESIQTIGKVMFIQANGE